MKKLLIILIFITNFYVLFSQCREFTYAQVMPKLDNFLLTGKYHAMQLSEGEEILIFKTISKGITYRFVIMSDNIIPQPHFKIIDWENNTIFDNEKSNNTNLFDYKCDKTQRIKIVIKVPKASSNSNIKVGCVSMVIGIKTN